METKSASVGRQVLFRTYTGTKTIKATRMGANDAQHYGAQITDDTVNKNICNDGYLVEYPDGYRSWSPKKSFDEAYRLAESYLDRLHIEHEDLKNRYLKGQEFLYSIDNINNDEKELLSAQMEIMRKYLDILALRIEYAKRIKDKEVKISSISCNQKEG